MLLVSDLPESDDCTGCCACKCFKSLTYPRVTTVHAALSIMPPVSDLLDSDDCTGCRACKSFQSLTYPRVTIVKAAVPTNASSL
ncbi:hypothetical protein DPMN_040129 [Dreissena polymorpha]|uniref:Uncharacterized protein n=1 Tax=Dreissena polymorpha TaxID=45954 RepID=A0A9D4CUH1_DREPO|nr:hypothetical protein DPMN_040129 [Dreissena polymorpha]